MPFLLGEVDSVFDPLPPHSKLKHCSERLSSDLLYVFYILVYICIFFHLLTTVVA